MDVIEALAQYARMGIHGDILAAARRSFVAV
jgi:hypothetical protein